MGRDVGVLEHNPAQQAGLQSVDWDDEQDLVKGWRTRYWHYHLTIWPCKRNTRIGINNNDSKRSTYLAMDLHDSLQTYISTISPRLTVVADDWAGNINQDTHRNGKDSNRPISQWILLTHFGQWHCRFILLQWYTLNEDSCTATWLLYVYSQFVHRVHVQRVYTRWFVDNCFIWYERDWAVLIDLIYS